MLHFVYLALTMKTARRKNTSAQIILTVDQIRGIYESKI